MTNRLPARAFTREEMMRRVAMFSDLKGFSSGFSDTLVPNTHRTLYNVMGFTPPPNGERSPVGADAARNCAIQVAEGFNLAYVHCKPGNGPVMHNHDTSETFIPMTGRWRCSWNEDDTMHVEVGPFDLVSFPPGAARRFENITQGEPDATHVLMVIVSGNAPVAETTERAQALIRQYTPA